MDMADEAVEAVEADTTGRDISTPPHGEPMFPR